MRYRLERAGRDDSAQDAVGANLRVVVCRAGIWEDLSEEPRLQSCSIGIIRFAILDLLASDEKKAEPGATITIISISPPRTGSRRCPPIGDEITTRADGRTETKRRYAVESVADAQAVAGELIDRRNGSARVCPA